MAFSILLMFFLCFSLQTHTHHLPLMQIIDFNWTFHLMQDLSSASTFHPLFRYRLVWAQFETHYTHSPLSRGSTFPLKQSRRDSSFRESAGNNKTFRHVSNWHFQLFTFPIHVKPSFQQQTIPVYFFSFELLKQNLTRTLTPFQFTHKPFSLLVKLCYLLGDFTTC